jgi:hypothetical protein
VGGKCLLINVLLYQRHLQQHLFCIAQPCIISTR